MMAALSSSRSDRGSTVESLLIVAINRKLDGSSKYLASFSGIPRSIDLFSKLSQIDKKSDQ
jgi:hypothetical protein